MTSLVERFSNETQSEQPDALLHQTTIERTHIGDLGIKLEPPLSHTERFVVVDWDFRWFRMGIAVE